MNINLILNLKQLPDIGHRDWENDREVKKSGCDPNETVDIARQLVEGDVGKNLKVILGGGRAEFRDQSIVDEENERGNRGDGRDLIDVWLKERSKHGNATYIWNKQSLDSLDINKTDYLLGLFQASHCLYNYEVEQKKLFDSKPTLADMTAAAIKVLNKEKNGFFLFVEGAKIDMGHHESWARVALDETKEFSKAVQLAREMTNLNDTLIVVTSDHAHTMTYNGYSVSEMDG